MRFAIIGNVIKKRNFHVTMENVYLFYGGVILKMIAEIIQTSKKICVLTKGTGSALNLSTDAITLNVSQLDGNVTMMTIVGMVRMNVIAL